MPRIERAAYVTSLKGIARLDAGYSRVYFGAEFCQWRMPGPAQVLKAARMSEEKGLGFTLVTPWVTDVGLDKLNRLFLALAREGYRDMEVVVNDYGVLSMLKKEFPSFTPVLGRLLVKRKCCPRIPGMLTDMPEAGREIYLHAGVEDPEAAKFLRKWGIRRAEVDYPLQGLSPDLKKARLKGSIYAPYAFVTTTRHCPASFDGRGWQAFTGCRIKGCLRSVIALYNPAHEARLVMRGNTQFIENRELPGDLAGMGIDRIVWMEDVP